MISSDPILEEVKKCLHYPRVRKRINLPDAEIESAVSALAIIADIAEGNVKSYAPCRDKHDLKYIEAAMEGRAEYLVSGDGHLLEIARWDNFRILTPREFIRVIGIE